MLGRVLAVLSVALALPAWAEELPRFRIEGDRLIYDTENVGADEIDSILSDDAEALFDLLEGRDDVAVLELNSTGGSLWAARRIADMVIDLELDTHVNGECASTCTRIFLGGAKRTMGRGSRIGFHQSWWRPGSIRSYYESEAEDEGWTDPFEFASWMYSDTQSEVHEQLLYMVRRGVDGVFAIETLKTSPDDMWYPYRARLLAAGVLTE